MIPCDKSIVLTRVAILPCMITTKRKDILYKVRMVVRSNEKV